MKHIWPIAARLAVMACALGAFPPASAADRWVEAGRGAVAILPAPAAASPVLGASLYCAEQRWALLLRTAPNAVADGLRAPAGIVVGNETFAATAALAASTIDIELPAGIIDPIKAANRMTVTVGAGTLEAEFPLRGSRKAVEAIAPRCSRIDMSAYEEISLSERDDNIAVAAELRAGETRLFRSFTGDRPVLAARTIDLADGKSLLFASLCGSKTYYGTSGCSLAGYARMSPTGAWQEAYETEGVFLYLDRTAENGGFPDLMTLPVVDGLQPTRWSWTGTGYAVGGAIVAERQEIRD